MIVLIVILTVAFIRTKLPILLAGLPSTTPDRHPKQDDWLETRQWKWVLTIASLTVIVVLGTSLALWGWERTATTRDSGVPALILMCCGLVLYTYNGYRLGLIGNPFSTDNTTEPDEPDQ